MCKDKLSPLLYSRWGDTFQIKCNSPQTERGHINLPAVDTRPYFVAQQKNHGWYKEKIHAAAQHHRDGANPCSLLKTSRLGWHIALHGERQKQTEVSILLQGPPLRDTSKSEAIELDDASRNTNRARADSRESANRFSGRWQFWCHCRWSRDRAQHAGKALSESFINSVICWHTWSKES